MPVHEEEAKNSKERVFKLDFYFDLNERDRAYAGLH